MPELTQQCQCSASSSECANLEELEQLRKDTALLRNKVSELEALVRTDGLTGLYNHRYFREALLMEFERTQRMGIDFCLVLIDIDHFKAVNDQYGHEVGNLVLKYSARLIKEALRPMDLPCRYGGEEFALLLPSTSLLTSVQVAERLRATLADAEIKAEEHTIHVTASFGVCSFSKDSLLTEEQLIAAADKQLYRAKRSGRNQVCYEPEAHTGIPNVSQDEKDMLSGLFGGD